MASELRIVVRGIDIMPSRGDHIQAFSGTFALAWTQAMRGTLETALKKGLEYARGPRLPPLVDDLLNDAFPLGYYGRRTVVGFHLRTQTCPSFLRKSADAISFFIAAATAAGSL